VIPVITWITRVVTIKRQTVAAYGPRLQPIVCTPALSVTWTAD